MPNDYELKYAAERRGLAELENKWRADPDFVKVVVDSRHPNKKVFVLKYGKWSVDETSSFMDFHNVRTGITTCLVVPPQYTVFEQIQAIWGVVLIVGILTLVPALYIGTLCYQQILGNIQAKKFEEERRRQREQPVHRPTSFPKTPSWMEEHLRELDEIERVRAAQKKASEPPPTPPPAPTPPPLPTYKSMTNDERDVNIFALAVTLVELSEQGQSLRASEKCAEIVQRVCEAGYSPDAARDISRAAQDLASRA